MEELFVRVNRKLLYRPFKELQEVLLKNKKLNKFKQILINPYYWRNTEKYTYLELKCYKRRIKK